MNSDFKDWGCEQSYSNYCCPPKSPGVYAITRPDIEQNEPVKGLFINQLKKGVNHGDYRLQRSMAKAGA